MDTIRFGIIGLGGMGSYHAAHMEKLEHAHLTAVCDTDPARLERAHSTTAQKFDKYQDLIGSGTVDAVLIATPHYFHPEISIAAMEKGLHVLCEKPIAVGIKQARQVNETYERLRRSNPRLKFAVMFQQRTISLYRKLRELIADGELGQISRVTWLITDWFRTWAYYASGGWRATWAGEGGGVLLNQCPHNLDLIQWVTGLTPSRVTAVASIGKTHPIEVEDEVSAIFEYPNGAIGHFVTTTGEAPGTNRLEICGDRGKIVAEHGKLVFTRTRKSVKQVRETSREAFARLESWDIEVPLRPPHAPPPRDDQHQRITENFIRAVLKDEPLIAPGIEGARSLELGNAIQMSGLTGRPVELPVDGEQFDQFLRDMTRQHGGRKAVHLAAPDSASADMAASFAKP
jgi:predicted dehydrogenase